jgi:hypothetical protein
MISILIKFCHVFSGLMKKFKQLSLYQSFRIRFRKLGRLPFLADLPEPSHQPLRNAPRPVRRDVEEVIGLPGIAELEHVHDLCGARNALFI